MNPDLPALRAVAEKATPGPWHHLYAAVLSGCDEYTDADEEDEDGQRWLKVYEYGSSIGDQQSAVNRDFIAAANPATILRLLDELEAARRVVEATRKYLGWGSINNADAVGKALAAYDAAVAKGEA